MHVGKVQGVKCKCSRKGPKIRFSNVRKLEVKPRYPFCAEEMIIVTLWTKVRGEQQHCLNPKRQNTVRLLKWYRVWKEKGSGKASLLGFLVVFAASTLVRGKAGTKDEFSGEDATELWLYLQKGGPSAPHQDLDFSQARGTL
ncbi:hypothetical protein WISP_39871 [Willisornis vidua]|uniref:Chemokine interleukin-8-like domain-containing protein n=1 Tax=Willisornis vidua TaxID=1566151 RepID=A0ABQ9DK05_9PASS|nr:hypothetical protein WISP_39871 [Willisornis vidua]